MGNRERHGGVVGPVILISLGVIFLLNNLGWLEWGVWETVLRLWPVLLIGAGLDLLIGRRSAWGSLLVALLLLAVLAGAIWVHQTRPSGPSATAQPIEQALQGATAARVDINPGVGELRLGALDESGLLLSGQIQLVQGERLVTEAHRTGSTLVYTLTTDRSGWDFRGPWGLARQWQVSLTPDVPIELTVNSGFGATEIDLSRLTITELTVNTGVGRTVLTVPATGHLSVNIDAGVGELVLRIPEGMGARIDASGGLAPISASPAFVRRGDLYYTQDFDTAENRLDLEIDLGIGSLRLEYITVD